MRPLSETPSPQGENANKKKKTEQGGAEEGANERGNERDPIREAAVRKRFLFRAFSSLCIRLTMAAAKRIPPSTVSVAKYVVVIKTCESDIGDAGKKRSKKKNTQYYANYVKEQGRVEWLQFSWGPTGEGRCVIRPC